MDPIIPVEQLTSDARSLNFNNAGVFGNNFAPIAHRAVKGEQWPFNTESNGYTEALESVIKTLHGEVFGCNKDKIKADRCVKSYTLALIREMVQGKPDKVSYLLKYDSDGFAIEQASFLSHRSHLDLVTHPVECFDWSGGMDTPGFLRR